MKLCDRNGCRGPGHGREAKRKIDTEGFRKVVGERVT